MSIWIDASAGASGDMLLGALIGAGVPLEALSASIDAVAPEPVTLRPEPVSRNGFAAIRCHVEIADSVHHRSWRDIRALPGAADPDADVRALAQRTFERLAVAEARVHGSDPMDVSFHEVGALDAIADVVGVCAGFVWLSRAGDDAADTTITVSPIAVGSGSVSGAHGRMPVPPPAVAELLRGAPSLAGPGSAESCTPTGAALLTTLADARGAQPAMAVESIGIGAGGRDPDTHANVLRIFVGLEAGRDERPLLIESNIDDLDPRVWPSVIAALLEAGASDARLTPILMKKGRPAHTLSVLTGSAAAEDVRAAIWRHTSTIGVRETALAKHALDREMVSVDVAGQAIDVKLAGHGGELVNAQPEWDDVARAAAVLKRPVNDVLAEAIAATRALLRTLGGPSPRSSE
ncbi:nickel pincer cofactor biosynthesis protein LarC [Nocardioides sp. B-3]|uniref:nickel pincer cofactor biosynthesis protein LarC n=1 Tax=Nocardioides sp. B-3 TaxID=2895565 RepID=UPI002152C8F0|nr:nickel pincer cofactor biosynthesis protein LarC [Nocardioides sp. B-3]UUZ60990.1 nickel pincer cofactor biosynthesis protein LarC [Nocardioides sp. B-3]